MQKMKTETGDKYNLIQNDRFLKKAYAAALFPCMFSILSGCINIIIDGILVGQKIGAAGLAAINLCLPVYLVLCIGGSFFVSGAAITAAQKVGDRDYECVQKCYSGALGICLILSALFTLSGIFLTNPVSGLLCGSSQLFDYVKQYTFYTLIGAAPKIFIYIPFNFLRIDGKNKSVMGMMMTMAVSNIILDFLFLFVFDMGVSGAAIASVLATLIACVIGFVSLHTGDSSFRLGLSLPGGALLKSIAVAGSPAAMNNLMQTVKITVLNSMFLSYGADTAVAVFSVMNGIAAFLEAVTLGVPQAGQTMIGVYMGELDYDSTKILLKKEFSNGVVSCAIVGVLVTAGSGLVKMAYGMDVSMFIPMLALALSLIPALWNNMMSSYYNVSGHNMLSNIIIISKTFVFTIVSLWILLLTGVSPWFYVPAAELLTILVWFLLTAVIAYRKKNATRYLLMDKKAFHGNVINFSVEGDEQNICDASERIQNFCEDNGINSKTCMRIGLAIEEILTIITQVNEQKRTDFDIRVFSIQDVNGIRIRYNGIDFNPLEIPEDDDRYMGIMMINNLVDSTVYNKVLGLNSMLILI